MLYLALASELHDPTVTLIRRLLSRIISAELRTDKSYEHKNIEREKSSTKFYLRLAPNRNHEVMEIHARLVCRPFGCFLTT